MLTSVVTIPSEAQDGPSLAKWTFLVYLDADNNLEDAGVQDVNEMESIGSTDDVNIIVQMDRIEEYDTTNGDWTGAMRFRAEKDEDTATMSSELLQDLGEVNMGDPEVAIDFIEWGVENYPAERYALVFWDHGGAFRGVCYDDTVPGSDDYDMINMSDLHYVTESMYQIIGNRRVDLVGFDACLMAQVAVLYEVKDYASVAVASGFNEPGDGWPYELVLGPLVNDPNMDEKELAEIISETYIYSYNNRQEDPQDYPMVTMAGFDMTKMDDVMLVLDQFSEELASMGALGSLEYLTQIYLARKNCNSYDAASVFIYDMTGYPLYDVIDFTVELEALILEAFPKNDLILDLCARLRTAIGPGDGRFMFVSNADQWHEDANGLSEYFPNKDAEGLTITQLPTTYSLVYEDTSFAREHLWDDFLHAFYGIDPIEDSLPTISIKGPAFNTSFSYDEEVVTVWGVAYDREMVDSVEVRIDGGEWTTVPGISGQGKIPWIHTLDIAELGPGSHIIEVRAVDRPQGSGEGVTGHVTAPVYTMVTVGTAPPEEDDGAIVPVWLVQVFAALVIIGGIIFGAILFKGRKG